MTQHHNREDARGNRCDPAFAERQRIKELLRRKHLALRDAIDKTDNVEFASKIRTDLRAFKPFSESECVSFYISVRSEVPTHIGILQSLEKGRITAVPKVCGNEIRLFQIKNMAVDLAPGSFGILEPRDHCPEIPIDAPTCHVVPGVVFDMGGNRIGYGKGFYDHYLRKISKNSTTIGLAFDCQIIDKFDAEPTDEPVDYLVSPSLGVFKTTKQPRVPVVGMN